MAHPTDTARSTTGFGTEGTTFEDGRAAAADSLKSAASYIGDKASNLPGSESVQRTAAAAADTVAASADYLRDTDFSAMATDLEEMVKRNPGPSLAVAAVAGFLIGRSLSR